MRDTFMKRYAIAVMVLVVTFSADAQRRRGGGGGERPDDTTAAFKSNPQVISAFKGVVAKPALSTLRILCDGKDAALATVVSADGYVITKNSELSGEITVQLKDGKAVAAEIVGVSDKHDLAMLKIDAKNLTPIVWASSKTAAVGDLLASPGSGTSPVAVGVLSVASRPVRMRDLPPTLPPANSGYLGVMLDEAEGGAKIMSVMPNSAAFKAGLKANDIVRMISDTEIIDTESMINTIQRHRPGDIVTIKLLRDHVEMEIKATLDKRAPQDLRPDRRDFQNRLGSELSDRRGGFPTIIQHDAVLRPSDCGGPLVDLDGKAIGINIARAGRVESYAIPSEDVQALLAELRSGKLKPAATQPATRPK
jgi:serine protease Do